MKDVAVRKPLQPEGMIARARPQSGRTTGWRSRCRSRAVRARRWSAVPIHPMAGRRGEPTACAAAHSARCVTGRARLRSRADGRLRSPSSRRLLRRRSARASGASRAARKTPRRLPARTVSIDALVRRRVRRRRAVHPTCASAARRAARRAQRDRRIAVRRVRQQRTVEQRRFLVARFDEIDRTRRGEHHRVSPGVRLHVDHAFTLQLTELCPGHEGLSVDLTGAIDRPACVAVGHPSRYGVDDGRETELTKQGRSIGPHRRPRIVEAQRDLTVTNRPPPDGRPPRVRRHAAYDSRCRAGSAAGAPARRDARRGNETPERAGRCCRQRQNGAAARQTRSTTPRSAPPRSPRGTLMRVPRPMPGKPMLGPSSISRGL